MINVTPIVNITPAAADKIKGIMEEQGEVDSALRIMVAGAGQYMMTLDKEPKEDDQMMEVGGIKLLIDSESAPLMEGSEIDFVETLSRTGFVISNPNFQGGGCACGGACSCGGSH